MCAESKNDRKIAVEIIVFKKVDSCPLLQKILTKSFLRLMALRVERYTRVLKLVFNLNIYYRKRPQPPRQILSKRKSIEKRKTQKPGYVCEVIRGRRAEKKKSISVLVSLFKVVNCCSFYILSVFI